MLDGVRGDERRELPGFSIRKSAGGYRLTTQGVFRIDHDQKFQQTTHLQYQPKTSLP